MKKLTYSEQLKDPRWQKKRLEILNRDSFMCQSCGEKEKSLHIHHLGYFYDRYCWEIEDEYLLTLCADCHEQITNYHQYAKSWLQLYTYDAEIIGGIGDIIELLYRSTPDILDRVYNYIKDIKAGRI